MTYSGCCNAPIIENTDLCSDCKEHCGDDISEDFNEMMSVEGKDVYYNGVKIKGKDDERVNRNSTQASS